MPTRIISQSFSREFLTALYKNGRRRRRRIIRRSCVSIPAILTAAIVTLLFLPERSLSTRKDLKIFTPVNKSRPV